MPCYSLLLLPLLLLRLLPRYSILLLPLFLRLRSRSTPLASARTPLQSPPPLETLARTPLHSPPPLGTLAPRSLCIADGVRTSTPLHHRRRRRLLSEEQEQVHPSLWTTACSAYLHCCRGAPRRRTRWGWSPSPSSSVAPPPPRPRVNRLHVGGGGGDERVYHPRHRDEGSVTAVRRLQHRGGSHFRL